MVRVSAPAPLDEHAPSDPLEPGQGALCFIWGRIKHMADGPETRLTRRIVKGIRERWPTAHVIKVHGGAFQQAGVPDLLVAVEGRLVGIEVKFPRPGESAEARLRRVTPRQQAEIVALRRAGCVAGVADSVESATGLIQESLNTHLTSD